MTPGPRREQIRLNNHEIESQRPTEHTQEHQPEHRQKVSVRRLLLVRNRTLQLLLLRLLVM